MADLSTIPTILIPWIVPPLGARVNVGVRRLAGALVPTPTVPVPDQLSSQRGLGLGGSRPTSMLIASHEVAPSTRKKPSPRGLIVTHNSETLVVGSLSRTKVRLALPLSSANLMAVSSGRCDPLRDYRAAPMALSTKADSFTLIRTATKPPSRSFFPLLQRLRHLWVTISPLGEAFCC